MTQIVTGLMALGFALIHIFIGKMRFLQVVPRSQWLSAAGGAAASYIFMHVLPELALHQRTFKEALDGMQKAEVLVYLVALTGLTLFYGLERMLRSHKKGKQGVTPGVFWIHISSFAVYNLLIGYLIVHREETGLVSLGRYFVAMSLHFVTNDHGLRLDHKGAYDDIGRWLIAAGVLCGWGLGVVTSVREWVVGLLFAFLAGGVVLNVLKEELPEDRESRFLPFLAGAVLYACLMLVI
jgi:hypothetical protein